MIEKTATEARTMQKEFLNDLPEHVTRSRFEGQVVSFIERWEPSDVHERHAFTAELYSLMRTVHMDMQKPVTDTVSALLATHMRPVFVSEKGISIGEDKE